MIDQYHRKAPLQSPSRVQTCTGCRSPVTVTEPDDGGAVLCAWCVRHLAAMLNCDDQLRMRLAPGSPRASAAALAAKVNQSRAGRSRQDVVLGSGSGSARGANP